MEELRRDAEKLAEERRLAREQAMEWTREVKMESDEERERKSKKTRKPKADGSGDEAEPKKKRRGKLKKAASDQGDAEDQAVFSDDEDMEKPAKKVCLPDVPTDSVLTLCSASRRSGLSETTTMRKPPDLVRSNCV